MLSDALVGMVESRAARRDAIETMLLDRVGAWWQMTDPFDGYQVQTFVDYASQLMTTSQQALVSLATAAEFFYLSELGVDMKDYFPEVPDEVRLWSDEYEKEYATPVPVTVEGKQSLRLPVAEVFNRPARQYRAEVSDGRDEDDALADSLDRVKIIAGTNLSLAEREAEHLILGEAQRQSPKVIGWRRVIHPELSKSGSCGLCVAASDRIYKVQYLKPIHDRCRCETLPLTDDNDPGDELNRQDLNRLYGEAGGTHRDLLKRTRYDIDEHGELQSVLVPARRGESVPRIGGTDTGTVDLDAFQQQQEKAQQQLPYVRQVLAQTIAKGNDDKSAPVKYQRAQIARLESIISGKDTT